MEKKGTLLIVTAVGVFLLAVLGAALILYSPIDNSTEDTTTFNANSNAWVLPNGTSQATSVQNNSLNAPLPLATEKTNATTDLTSTTPVINQTVTAESVDKTAITQTVNQTTENTGTAPSILSSNSQPVQDLTVYSTNTTVIAKNGTTTLDLATPKTTRTEPVTTTPTKTTAPVSTTMTTSSNTQTVAKTSTSATSNSTSKITPKKTVAVVTAKTTTPDPSYWVQAASYTNKTNANEARDNLQIEEIPSEVFTYQKSNGVTYYRLRVGPYLTASEAEYWNKRIRLVDEFANSESYVTNTALPVNK